jgi:hypothetical protein
MNSPQGFEAGESKPISEIRRQLFEKVRQSMIRLGIEVPDRSSPFIELTPEGLDCKCPTPRITVSQNK